jgi:hypothetical protein
MYILTIKKNSIIIYNMDVAYLNQIKKKNLTQISTNVSQIDNMKNTISLTTDELNSQISVLESNNSDLTKDNLIIDDIINIINKINLQF